MTSAYTPADSLTTGHLFARTLAVGLVAFSLWTAWSYPAAALPLTLGLAAYALLLLARPAAWLIVIPAVLPAIELSYWSGRLFFTEFDLLVLVTLASGLWHGGPGFSAIDRGTRRVGWVLLLAHAAVTLHGLLPLYAPAPGAWDDYFASTNALREFRGLLYALLLWPMLGAARARGDDIQRWFVIGMLAGLVAAVASIVWERGLFTGLFDFSHPYRISGWFISMHTGGAAIDAFLAMTVPFALAPLFLWRNPAIRVTTAVWLMGGLYAFYVTYSRANYPALIAMLTVFVIGLSLAATRGNRAAGRQRSLLPLLASVGFVGMMLLLVAVSLGPNIERRFATSSNDMQTRLSHWADVIEVAQNDPSATWIGRGKGRFAYDYYWDRTAAGEHLALAQRHTDGDGGFIRFSPSDPGGALYLRQRFERTPSDHYRLELQLRTPGGEPEGLLIEFCERHMLKFLAECRWRKVNLPASDGRWMDFTVNVDLGGLGHAQFGPFSRPLEVALMNRGIGHTMDIGAVQLYDIENRSLLGNSDFASGWDNWFLSYGNHLRWHIKSVILHWFYEGGFALLAVMLGVGLYTVIRLGTAANAGDAFALLSLVAIVGTLAVGLFDSLFDDVRVSLLFFMLLGTALISRPQGATMMTMHPLMSARTFGRLAKASAVGVIALAVLYLVWPSLFRPLEVRVAIWAEGRGSVFARWLSPDYSEDVSRNLAATMGTWQPLPATDSVLQPGEIRIGERRFDWLTDATRALLPGDHLRIGPGIYRQPMIIAADNVKITGSGHVVIERAQARGKAAIITAGNNTRIENIECRHIRVSDGNGACIRHEGRNLELRHVYFHDAEQGLLSGRNPGRVHIRDSRFERLGRRGSVHGIQVDGGELVIEDTHVLATTGWAHAISSTATTTRIVRSTLASLGSNDSRLLDLPRGGVLEISDSVLQHGPVSANDEAIGFALAQEFHPEQRIELSGNTIVLERDGGNRLFEFGELSPALTLAQNRMIGAGDIDDGDANRQFDSREAAGLGAFPQLPRR